MSLAEQLRTIRRWVYCRCVYSRRPTDPCSCTPAQLARAEREDRHRTREREEALWERDGHDGAR